jgi:peptidase M23-like protein
MSKLGGRGNRFLIGMVVAAGGATLVSVAPVIAAVNGAPQLTFPWGSSVNADNANPNGQFNYGPHDFSGIDTNQHVHPWNSLDLAPLDGRVYAARGGTAYVECGGERIQIVHGDGYVTSYVHLDPATVRVSNGQYVLRSTWLANFRTSNAGQLCGIGYNHVHFSLWYVPSGGITNYSDGQAVDWAGIPPTALTGQAQIGGWTVDDGIPQQVYGGCMTPLASPGVRYCGLTQGTRTIILNDSPAEQVPVASRPQGGTEDLFMRATNIHGLHAPTDVNGTPYFWEDLGGLLKGSPTGVWNSTTTQLDVFGIGMDDRVFHIVWTSSGWGAWVPIATGPGSLGFSGPSETESVNVERESSGQMDLFIRGVNGDAQHALLSAGGALIYWESLGGLVKGAPSGRWNMAGTRLDVYAIDVNDRPQHIYWQYPPGSWQPWSGALQGQAASAGTEMIMTVRRPNDQMDLFMRGPASDGLHAWTDTAGNIGAPWESLGGIIKGAPDGKWNAAQTRLDVFAIGIQDWPHEITWSNGWSSWHPLSGGGVWG